MERRHTTFKQILTQVIGGLVTGAVAAGIAVAVSLAKFEQQIEFVNKELDTLSGVVVELAERRQWFDFIDIRITALEKQITMLIDRTQDRYTAKEARIMNQKVQDLETEIVRLRAIIQAEKNRAN